MKKLLFLGVACLAFTMISCNKDQAAVKKLTGTWNVTSSKSTTGGVTVDNLSYVDKIVMTFNECKLKKDEWCTGSSTVTAGAFSLTDDQTYRVTGDGTQLEVRTDTSSTADIMSIDELTKTNLKLTLVSGSTSTVTEATKE